jgi:hypothetical protein
VIAHNGGGYDNKFILNWAIKHGIYPSKYIRQGSKITYKTYRTNNLRFIDSLSFVARPLRDFPEVFGITEDVKGYFPHHFNTPENQNYIGPIPDKHFYGPENMNPKVNKAFNEWYDKQGDILFNFKEEMIKYCKSDVEVLARGVLKFRQIFYSKCDVDPLRYVTISSLCMNIYKAKFMPKIQL